MTSATASSFVGIGLGRFAYTPLLPAVVDAGWFAAGQSAYLGAANLAGYLLGALVARRLAATWSARSALRAMMAVVALSFLACATPLPFAWFFAWRFASGVAGGVLMVLTAPAVMPSVPPERRGVASGCIFAGVGLGIINAGTLVPLLLQRNLEAAWIGIGALALVLTFATWNGWPAAAPTGSPAAQEGTKEGATIAARGARLRALYLTYGLNAVGLVAHMLFLVDFVARGLGQGVLVGSMYWIIFGVAAMAGPVLAGYAADRIGFVAATRVGIVLQAVAVGLLLASSSPFALVASTLGVGAFVSGITSIVFGRVGELVAFQRDAHEVGWRGATVWFAVGQAAAAYGYSAVFASTGSYAILFAIALAALIAALLVDLGAGLLADGGGSRTSARRGGRAA